MNYHNNAIKDETYFVPSDMLPFTWILLVITTTSQLFAGLVLGYQRTKYEPLFNELALKEIYSYWGIIYKKSSKDQTKLKNVEMQTELSIDLLNTILKAITDYNIGNVKTEWVDDEGKQKKVSNPNAYTDLDFQSKH